MVPHGLVRPGGHGKARRNVFERLEDVVDGHALFKARADGLAKGLFDVLADDKDELAESGAQGVEDGVIDDGFAGGADRIDLFEAAVAAAHAGGENEEGRRIWGGHRKGLCSLVLNAIEWYQMGPVR